MRESLENRLLRLGQLQADALMQACKVDKGNKAAATRLRAKMQEVKALANEIRVAALKETK